MLGGMYLHRLQAEVFKDKHRFRVVCSGRRWGKTLWCLAEILRAASTPKQKIWYVAPTYRMAKQIMWVEMQDRIPKSYILKSNETNLDVTFINGTIVSLRGADKPDCYDEQTEILTRDGWVKFSDMKKGVEVLTLNPKTNKAEWKVPYKYVDQAYEGPMYRIASKKLDLLVTPEHKFLVDTVKGERKLKPIEEINHYYERIPASVDWDGVDDSSITDDHCALLGFYLAKGSCATDDRASKDNHEVVFSQTPGDKCGLKGDVRSEFKDVLTRLGYSYRETQTSLVVCDKELRNQLKPLGNKYVKRIPKNYLELPPAKLRTILAWMLTGDGSARLNDISYYTVSKELADDLQELAIKSGLSARISIKSQNECEIDDRLIKATTELYQVHIFRNRYNYFRDSKESYITKEWYNGRVYCVGVENHVIMVRRNGKACWSGNTLRGVGIDFIVLDEVQDIKPDAWTLALRPTLASTRGRGIFCGTPKQYSLLWELFQRGNDPKYPNWKSWQFPTITSPFIPLKEIEDAKADMDERSFRQEFLASFENMSGRVYHAFSHDTHVGKCPFNPKLPIWVGQDFNIDPMSSVIIQRQLNGELWVVDELYLPSSNTLEVCDELERRYWRYKNQITIYPDPAGGNRQTGRGESDLDIFRERGFKRLRYRKKHPMIADRVNAVNKMLRAADGTIRLRINESCKHLISSLDQTLYKKGTSEIDKAPGVEHISDALGYPVELEYPRRKFSPNGMSI